MHDINVTDQKKQQFEMYIVLSCTSASNRVILPSIVNLNRSE